MAGKGESEQRQSYWREQITLWESSNQPQKLFCQAQGLNYHQFGYWRRRLQELNPPAEKQSGGFAPVRYHHQPRSPSLALSLPNGLVLRGIASDNLSIVFQLISRLS